MITAQEVIDKFEPIPENLWIRGHFTNLEGCCVLGHWGRLHSVDPDSFDAFLYQSEMTDLIEKLRDWSAAQFKRLYPKAPKASDGYYHELSSINNGTCPQYPQDTPKQRVMAFLHDCLA